MKVANRRLRGACACGAVVVALLAASGGAGHADGVSERTAKVATTASLRRALRTATVLLAARAAQAMDNAMPPGKLPMNVFVGPVAVGAGADASEAAGVTAYKAQGTALHEMVADFAGAAVLGDGGDTIFAVHAGSRRRGRGSSAPLTEAAEREMARKAGADYLIEVSLLQSVGGADNGGNEGGKNGNGDSSGSEVHLALQLVDARDGTVVCVSDTALPEVSTVAKDSAVDRKKG